MAEQYIYSRSDKGFTNARGQEVALGFGFVAYSPGMNKALKDAVTVHCKECPELDGPHLPLLRKACLPKGQTLLQEITWITDGERKFHVAHGYVLEEQEARAAGPAAWFAAPFRLENPNLTEDGILLDGLSGLGGERPFRADSLGETMGALGLDRQNCCRMLLACLDALAAHTQLLIAYDFQAFQQRDFRPSVLYWLYSCLPRALWSAINFDSVFSGISTPGQVQIAFVDRGQLYADEKYPNIRVGTQTITLGSRFLVLDGRIIHNENKSKSEWCGGGGIYARWLEQLVSALWDCPPEDAGRVVQALDGFYDTFQKQLDAVWKEEALQPQRYDAVCERSLDFAPEALNPVCAQVRGGISQAEHIGNRLALADILETGERREILEYMLRENHKAPMTEKEAALLCRLSESDAEIRQAVEALLGAFMAEETDILNHSVSQTVERYGRLLPAGLSAAAQARLLTGARDEREAAFWTECHVDGGEARARARRKAWYTELVPERAWENPGRISKALARFGDGLSTAQLAELWQEPFGDQCAAAPKSSLRGFANRELPENLRSLERELSKLPGGAPQEALGMLEMKAYELLLDAPTPFMTAGWLNRASAGCKAGGETKETMAMLAEFAAKATGSHEDTSLWMRCRRRYPNARKQVFGILPKMYLIGTLPQVESAFLLSFLHQMPDASEDIVARATAQGGGRLLMELLHRSRRYERPLGRSGLTDLQAILRCVTGDPRVLNQLGEEADAFYRDLESFLNSGETKRALPPDEISRALDYIGQLAGASGRKRHNRAR